MITFENKEHFKEAVAFSKKLGGESQESFKDCFRRLQLNHNNSYKDCELVLWPDTVGHSMRFAFIRKVDGKEKCVYGGNVLLHGFEQTFTVTLEPIRYPQWRIHT